MTLLKVEELILSPEFKNKIRMSVLTTFIHFSFFLEGLANSKGASKVVQEVKNLPANARATGDTGSIPGLGRFPGGGNGNPLQYSCLGNPMDRGACWATVHGVAKSQT